MRAEAEVEVEVGARRPQPRWARSSRPAERAARVWAETEEEAEEEVVEEASRS